MTLKDLLKKKEKIKDEGATRPASTAPKISSEVPEFTFMRTTTTSQSIIQPPSFPGDPTREEPLLSPEPHKKLGRFRRHSNVGSSDSSGEHKGEHRLSERLHFGRTRSSSSVNVPENLPEASEGVARTEDDEAKWEKRATVLATGNTLPKSPATTPKYELPNPMEGNRGRSKSIGTPVDDVCLWPCWVFRVRAETLV